MNEGIVAVELTGDEPVAWLRESLEQGAAISQHVLPLVESKHGRFSVLVPRNVKHEALSNLREGGVASTKLVDIALGAQLEKFSKAGNNLLYVEDEFREVGNAWLEKMQSNYLIFDTRVVHWADLSMMNGLQAVSFIQKASHGYPLNAFVASVRADTPDAQRHATAGTLAVEIAAATRVVIVSAFDGETFLLWDMGFE